MRVALNGASGFVASHLKKLFFDYVVIERNDTEEQIVQKLQGVDVVFNLAGAPIIKRWSDEYKKILLLSRVQSTNKLVSAINKSDVSYFISTSAIGAYPSDGVYDESYTEYGSDFLASLTKEWESEALKCEKPTAIVRFGVVLSSDGGALKEMLLPFKMGVGGKIGSGEMKMSWIDVDDLVNIYAFLCEKRLTGTFNATTPFPLTNAEFTTILGSVLHRPTLLPLPEFVLKLMYGEGASVITDSKEVYPKALMDSGYTFLYPNIRDSLEHHLL
ncbi:MAG: TIGR01777 family oxidoreductase [Campylobacterales bacterium]|nr:TIGR01777 family oxidoreductase [Campylobacterales bacterium]